MVLDDKENIIGVSIKSCVGEGELESASGVFVGADPGPDIVVV